ncbi:hypothetical protein K469DRAFT_725218 [Zopfia rhizophila CBS 207.26]|uniref:FAS1 domain-containing protein n=1 Tax=Zopfia rhizophila CBS 207.26 TaxID=1314779 RepID=A0A6A6E759_9PEZI|nr:hypothetical protein K469DRAFT_725218 [Zopfia rhizophila CBS 207.26]
MKPAHLFAYPTTTIYLVLAASAQSRPFDSLLSSFHIFGDQSPLRKHNPLNQVMPHSSEEVSTGVILSDVIGKTQDIAIFSGLTRDIDPVADRLDDASKNATVLAPDNGVMRNLKRKPWEDPNDYEVFGKNAYDGGDGQDRAHKNLRRFVEAHIVPESPWQEGQKVKTLAGNEIWYESKEAKKVIQPGNVQVTSIADKVANGEIWIMGGILDPRQYVPATGQAWTSLAQEKDKHKNEFIQDKADERIWFITTEPKLGIGERAILLLTPSGNVLWDMISFLDSPTIEFINSKGGLKAIVISHPHFYTTHLEWAKNFNCPVYTSKEDEGWLNRKDHYGFRKFIEGPTETIVDGVTAIKCGGHFDGSLVLHWDKKLFIADTLYTVPSALYHKDRLPGTTSYSFMWSIPNMIPLPPPKIHAIWKALKPFDFEATYGGFTGQDVRRPDLKNQVLESMKIQVRGEGHVDAAIFQESLE